MSPAVGGGKARGCLAEFCGRKSGATSLDVIGPGLAESSAEIERVNLEPTFLNRLGDLRRFFEESSVWEVGDTAYTTHLLTRDDDVARTLITQVNLD
jgi:hypothetical protein